MNPKATDPHITDYTDAEATHLDGFGGSAKYVVTRTVAVLFGTTTTLSSLSNLCNLPNL